MLVKEAEIAGVLIFEPKIFADQRGYFFETWSQDRYRQAGIKENFVQDNVSFSQRGVLRGLHFQYPNEQGKLVQVLSGQVFDVAVDIRVGSPTFGKYVGVELSEENHRQMYIPTGFAHGFCVCSETAFFSYKCTNYYDQKTEGGVIYNDPDIGIEWPISNPVLSSKDAAYGRLGDIPESKLPKFRE
ncbi:MAG: dTDP-4-dehydrorhamnose 3,5-epimerase [Phycisphaerae bacterium]|nr:dTDP-4-dehydrorhamnose 3,5-epimerase [Phycisphaerae bacterium]